MSLKYDQFFGRLSAVIDVVFTVFDQESNIKLGLLNFIVQLLQYYTGMVA